MCREQSLKQTTQQSIYTNANSVEMCKIIDFNSEVTEDPNLIG